MSQDYNNTINLPKTDFPMRASLPQREPEMLKQWKSEDYYNKLMKKNKDKKPFILHDGPPYANGDIHTGHALNKILKDFVLRYKNMSGFRAPYIPGWDMHGLPTELKAIKKFGLNRDKVTTVEFREQCREFVEMYAANQSEQFQRLGILGDWENPYYTIHREFEAKQIEIFGDMMEKGFIYKGLKPVYWCPTDETALAEAEIEYAEDPCDSIYVKFKVTDDKGVFAPFIKNNENVYFVIWTTTTWTLPANVAICVGPRFEYSLVKTGNDVYVIANELVNSAMKAGGISDFEIIGTIKGADMELIETAHPFIDRTSLIIVGDHVTLETGTGCVHTAPGHGVDDYNVCLKYKQLGIPVPVDSKGYMNEQAGSFCGLKYTEANTAILEHLKEIGALFAVEKVIHQYPHCWRCKSPIIFRATEQWFCSIDSIREQAIEAIKKVNWVPAWGEERIINMVRERNDWCISRQRTWGVPIPIFYCKDCGEPIVNKETIKCISELFAKEGSIAWYKYTSEEILPKGTKCPKCNCETFEKETDIMDVWFDSGVSHSAVLDNRSDLSSPADLYLEGNDQYRGWFQSSLLTDIAYKGEAPYKTVLTHGFIVDENGKKMSKSLGNGIEPSEIINEFGADILRLWVASTDYKSEIRLSKVYLKQLSEGYRKVRNTARYILGNISDFDPKIDLVEANEISGIDKWAIYKANELVDKATRAYEEYDYHVVFQSLLNFCSVEMSSFYLDIIKDRLYCENKNSFKRRSAQSAMYLILKILVKVIAPILAYTSEEIWSAMPHTEEDDVRGILFNEFPKSDLSNKNDSDINKWNEIFVLRNDVKKALEPFIKNKTFKSSLEAEVVLYCEDSVFDKITAVKDDLKSAFIVSEVKTIKDKNNEAIAGEYPGVSVIINKAFGNKCERCWMIDEYVGTNKEHPTLCERCAKTVDNM